MTNTNNTQELTILGVIGIEVLQKMLGGEEKE